MDNKNIVDVLTKATIGKNLEWKETSSYLAFSAEFDDIFYLIAQDPNGDTTLMMMDDMYIFNDLKELTNTDSLKKLYALILETYPVFKERVEDCLKRIEMERNSVDKWEMLKSRVTEQLEDCRKHSGASGNWNVVSRIYGEIISEMKRIEDGSYVRYKPYNGVWHTDEEIKEIQ